MTPTLASCRLKTHMDHRSAQPTWLMRSAEHGGSTTMPKHPSKNDHHCRNCRCHSHGTEHHSDSARPTWATAEPYDYTSDVLQLLQPTLGDGPSGFQGRAAGRCASLFLRRGLILRTDVLRLRLRRSTVRPTLKKGHSMLANLQSSTASINVEKEITSYDSLPFHTDLSQRTTTLPKSDLLEIYLGTARDRLRPGGWLVSAAALCEEG